MKTHTDVKLHRGMMGNALKCLTPLRPLCLQPAKRVILKNHAIKIDCIVRTERSEGKDGGMRSYYKVDVKHN